MTFRAARRIHPELGEFLWRAAAGLPAIGNQPRLDIGLRTALVTSAAIMSTIGFGVAARTNSANQELTLKLG